MHIPFCVQRCFYCDFPVRVIGANATVNYRQSESYTKVLIDEIRTTCQRGESEGLWQRSKDHALETLYFGGGTPSLMPPEHLRQIIEALTDEGFPLSPSAEVTLEMDPGTFDRGRLEHYLRCGVTRVNLGVQSFNSSILEAAGRFHRAPEVDAALASLQSAGMRNVGLDLISGLPLLTLGEWKRTLLHACELQSRGLINHVSVYDLTLEPESAFGRSGLEPGAFPLPEEASTAEMLRVASEILQESGFEHYEVSNFALPGRRSRHNMAYWARSDFLGFGMGATSYLGGHRFARPSGYRDYALWTAVLQDARLTDALREEPEEPDEPSPDELSAEERALDDLCERVMLALRTSDGLDLAGVRRDYGALAERVVEESLMKNRHLVVKQGRRIRLTAPDGFMMSNDVISTVFADLEDLRGALKASS